MTDRDISRRVKIIRDFVGELAHHPNCRRALDIAKKCNCYAGDRNEVNDALQDLLDELQRLRGGKA